MTVYKAVLCEGVKMPPKSRILHFYCDPFRPYMLGSSHFTGIQPYKIINTAMIFKKKTINLLL